MRGSGAPGDDVEASGDAAAQEGSWLLPARRRHHLPKVASSSTFQADGKLRAALEGPPGPHSGDGADEPDDKSRRCSVGDTLLALLSLQLGWGLWLMPHSFGQLGWLPGLVLTAVMAGTTAWSGGLFARLFAAAPGAVLFGDIGQKAAGPGARALVYAIVYALDATRCVILHLAATQSLVHALGPAHAPPLRACGAAVLAAVLGLSQVRSLARLSWFFAMGTAAQLCAIGLVCFEMFANPYPSPARALVVRPAALRGGAGGIGLDDQVVAAFNIIFAYGGQFAFVELMAAMARPAKFPVAVTACTGIMSSLYAALGAFGYVACGAAASEILVFSFPDGGAARAAGACVLLQALAQYLVNANVWAHNLLVLLSRRRALLGKAGGGAAPACSSDHAAGPWLLVTSGVVLYSYLISMTIPFFSTLVGIVSSSTYLLCAYTLPCWFALRLLAHDLGAPERLACRAAIPLTLALSALGLVCSASTLARRMCPGGHCALAGAVGGGHGVPLAAAAAVIVAPAAAAAPAGLRL
ncbi:MAG: transmembrane amino acid transporter protein-domain-containing protein [Monoraphidium minutum]|nr:MAG: transmembrane amino acid transporter protein-domain-containing protein [Monoraphidium minutum]